MPPTPHEQAEAELTAYGLGLPETALRHGWAFTRVLYVRRAMFAQFGDKAQPRDQLTFIAKLPISYEMVQDLWFVRENRGWYRQHGWTIAHFAAGDDVLAEMETLKAWMRQSYRAQAPRTLALQVGEG
jgi:hypothetical protein